MTNRQVLTAVMFFIGLLATGGSRVSFAQTCAASPISRTVTICAPTANAVVASPVRVVATTADSTPVHVTQVYVDGTKRTEVLARSINTSVPLSPGRHEFIVQAIDTARHVFRKVIYITVVPSNGTRSNSPVVQASAAPKGASLTTYNSNLTSAGNWIAASSMLADGAILYSADEIVPYYSNIAAIGMTKNPASYSHVKAWMQWYISHLNASDVWGLGNSMYDYGVSGSVETPRGNADSTDSYPATFMSLAWDFYRTGDASAQSYVRSILSELDAIGQQLIKTQQSDGLTWAKPDYQIKYLMDNCEVYRGLRDLAALFQAVGNGSRASYYNTRADLNYQGLMGMWLGNAFAPYKDGLGRLAAVNWNTWYADATSQLFPVLEGVIPASDPKAQQVYASFNRHWPNWPNLSFNSVDPFPWVLVCNAAATMGDSARVNTYVVNIQDKYVTPGYPWPWYSMEAGWFMRVNAYMAGKGF